MASTLTASTLTVTIKEDINLNGQAQGATTSLSVASINEVYKRIISLDSTNSTNLLAFGDVNGLGQFHNTDVRYVRVTNLDNTNYATLRVVGDSSTDFSVRLDPGASWLAAVPSTLGMDDFGDNAGVVLEKITSIAGTSNTAAVDLEVFVASA